MDKKHKGFFLSLPSRIKSAKDFFAAPKNQLFVGLAAIAMLIVAGALFEYIYKDKFYPGVSVGNVKVGGKTYAEVVSLFDDKAKVVKDTGLQLTLLDQGTTKGMRIPMSAPGFNPDKSFEYFSLGDWKKTIQDAYDYGHTGSSLQRALRHIRLVFGKTFPLPAVLYETSVESLLTRELELFLKKTEPAQFVVSKKGIVSVVPEKIGETVNVADVISVLEKKLAALDPSTETIKAKIEIPSSTEEKLRPYLTFAQELSQKSKLTFRYKTHAWSVSGAKLVSWLTIKEDGEIGIDGNKLESFLSETVALVIDDLPQNSRFKMNDGTLEEIVPGQPGNVVDVTKTANKVDQVIHSTQRSFASTGNIMTALAAADGDTSFNTTTGEISIPVATIQEAPRVTKQTITQYNIYALVGSSKTSFKGSSADRIKNITVGASKLNGMLIAPGEEFSAVNAIGYVTERAGYVREYVIKDNRSVKELGGGLCQIATTLFRLALNTGLPITERANHRYVVSYYGPGLDATIYGPHPDLRFVNDTGHYLLLQGRVVDTDLIFELYGQKDGRQVSISDPILSNRIPAPETKYVPTSRLAQGAQSCSETPREGMTADVTYRVALPSGEIREQNFNSVYQPWQKICLMGTRASGH